MREISFSEMTFESEYAVTDKLLSKADVGDMVTTEGGFWLKEELGWYLVDTSGHFFENREDLAYYLVGRTWSLS